MPTEPISLAINHQDREELRLLLASKTLEPDGIFRANLILLLADGRSYSEIQNQLHTTAPTIARWKRRFADGGVEGILSPLPPARKASVITDELKERVIAATCRRPSDGTARWSCRSLARELGLSKDVVQRIWRSEGLRPHRLERFMATADNKPANSDVEDIVGLFVKQAGHAAVFSHRKKTVVQREEAISTVRTQGPESEEVSNTSSGQLSLYRILSGTGGHARSGKSLRLAKTDCLHFLEQLSAAPHEGLTFTIVLDRLGREDLHRVERFLRVHPAFALHLAQSRSAWFRRVEEWCAGSIPASVPGPPGPGLGRQIGWHIRALSKTGKGLVWISSALNPQY